VSGFLAYRPKVEITEGSWTLPPVRKLETTQENEQSRPNEEGEA
jgi:hypothetical protein